jgi:hypothetical protein
MSELIDVAELNDIEPDNKPFRCTAEGTYHGLSAELYHADPCPTPSLSSSMVKLLCDTTPAHARLRHPRLVERVERDNATHFDIGTAAHAIVLQGQDAVVVVDAADWRTNAAKEQRDKAYAEGKTPLLAKIKAEVDRMVAAFRSGLDRHQEGARMFEEGFGTPESTLIWQDLGGVWCRARLDWLRADKRSGIAIDDYKTTATSADPADLARTYIGKGWDIQAAWYLRGARAVLNTTKAFDMTFRYAVQETYAPYAVSVVTPGADALMLAEKKILWALSLWARCLERDEWPGYHTQTAHLALPAWEESRWLTKEVSDAF